MPLLVDVAPEVVPALQDRVAAREVRHAIVHAMRAMLAGELAGRVRPWDLPGLRARAATLGELQPGGQRIVSTDLGQGETETRHRYQWVDGRGLLLTGSGDNAVVTEG